jgi:20S proteasome subunit beta 5
MVNLINHYKRYGLSMGLMLAGTDEKGSNLYYVNTEGSRLKGHLFSVGSGMTFAYGVLDSFYRYDMSLEEAVELGRKAICHATFKDTGSGGVVRVFHVHKDGWTEKIAGDDVNKLYYAYQAQKGFTNDEERGKL